MIKYLTNGLRENYILLMKSPMPMNRKIMATALAIDFNLLATPLKIYNRVRGKLI